MRKYSKKQIGQRLAAHPGIDVTIIVQILLRNYFDLALALISHLHHSIMKYWPLQGSPPSFPFRSLSLAEWSASPQMWQSTSQGVCLYRLYHLKWQLQFCPLGPFLCFHVTRNFLCLIYYHLSFTPKPSSPCMKTSTYCECGQVDIWLLFFPVWEQRLSCYLPHGYLYARHSPAHHQ